MRRLRRERADVRLTFLSSKELQADLTRPRQRPPLLPTPIALYLIVVVGTIAALYFYFRA